ncbi:23S rRNA (uracil(1939)-C(5))-methyltransferase RlmD [Geomonas nitrogeniifigens]|uniref:23S rRNA (Uracil(1939)-C(5))-methyltransferase RlmD n=1 Tax=Geomonas diazotrophica TaxID=2843197 RepID=A0ABX8JLP0_9BACT|nr:23S rRNA (uracil(1939)-C(5))-methyltransferase RlmD [Geomonas nitrogeniifigens]QWV99290.1 23S rRNA (uracil(1939)-C(5))-methyltransferase RlmD [Geomonas nitrogeniifigens]QXE88457.1 23S rRNA (uracil(1939)-C(5))-methyltransferase RlmD [Geomonas nitrogeniifigens]
MADPVVFIESLCYGGAGFGRVDGKACFVPFTAPGDRARIRVVKDKRSFLEGELAELVEPSALRVAPACPVFGECGGCDWQFLSYPEQLLQKGSIFADTLARIGKIAREKVLPVAASPEPYGYRSRVQVKVSVRAGAVQLGFFRTGSHNAVDFGAGCPLANPRLNRMAAEFRALIPRLPQFELIHQVDLAIGDQGEGIAIVHSRGGAGGRLVERLAQERSQLPSVAGAFLRSGQKGDLTKAFGIEALSYRVPADLLPGSKELTLRFGRGGFSQVNYPQNLELIRTACEWAGLTGKERVLDLYCGNGNISLPLALRAAEVLGIEGYAPSIADAVANAEANGIENAVFQVSDAAQAVRRLVKRKEKFDTVVLDPPRGGAEAAAEIAALAPGKIIYVSCDPATLARDLATLCSNGYQVTRSRPVDMFPQTYHLESVTELVIA